MSLEQDIQFLIWLIQECGYRAPKPIGHGRCAFIQPKLFTHSIAVTRIGNYYGINDFWCYSDYVSAKTALDAWDGTGEPKDWFRHTPTGRRISPLEGAYDDKGRWIEPGELYVRR
jgi:hypothetical protein